MKTRFIVEVLPDAGDANPKRYTVVCDTADDALLIAFALDGGWSTEGDEDTDASGMLELAKSYCAILCSESAERCEHDVPDGEYCEPCNREYKRAAAEFEGK